MDALTRRAALQQVMLAGAGLALAPNLAWPAAWQIDAGRELLPFEDIPENFATKRTGDFKLPGQDALGIDLRNVAAKTNVNETFIVSHYNTPMLDAGQWRLTVEGNAGRRLQLTLDELKRRPRVERTVTFECGGNREAVMHRMISTCSWTGASLKDLLRDARPAEDVIDVIFWGADRGEETIRNAKYEMNFARSMPIEDADASDAILAYEVDGAPLPVVHGFPVRLIVPGWYGVAQVKWLTRIDLSADRLMTRFMARDYVTLMGYERNGTTEWVQTSVTRMRPKSAIARVTRSGDRMRIFGAAWTGGGIPLDRVEVQVDGGDWRPATLERSGNPLAWTFFDLDIPALRAGEHTLVSRAWDARGNTQPVDLSMKKTRWENNELFTRTILVS